MLSDLELLLEDDHLLVVNKPAGVLSQPGKSVDGSIATAVKDAYPESTGPMLIHRLDMDTSGLMIFAKSKSVHKHIHQQFEQRLIAKQYTAILSRAPIGLGGQVLLPLRVDIDNRPTQIVCHSHGKHAVTLWRSVNNAGRHPEVRHRVLFTPITGRTHQLRVHAAHAFGLNAPIVGDRLYGSEDKRMLLHASFIGFWHPVSGKRITVSNDAPF